VHLAPEVDEALERRARSERRSVSSMAEVVLAEGLGVKVSEGPKSEAALERLPIRLQLRPRSLDGHDRRN
jgi:hypothetical protein